MQLHAAVEVILWLLIKASSMLQSRQPSFQSGPIHLERRTDTWLLSIEWQVPQRIIAVE
jgi:hypothetical protein